MANDQSGNFNHRIAKYFLDNTRLTILSLMVLLVLGVISTLLLKTTGFPNPDIKFASIQAVYPGASSATVLKDVTQPLEGAIKNVAGVSTYSSFSNNSISVISVTIDESANADAVRSKLDTAISSVTLPSGVEKPVVQAPEINGPDFYYSLIGDNTKQLFDLFTTISRDLAQIPETASVTSLGNLEQKVVVSIDQSKLQSTGITSTDIQHQLQFIGESLPVISDVTLDNTNKTIVTTVSGSTLEDIKNIQFKAANSSFGGVSSVAPPKYYKLSDLASVEVQYVFDKDAQSTIAYHTGSGSETREAITFAIKTSADADKAAYANKVDELFKDYSGVSFLKHDEIPQASGKLAIIENFSTNESNQQQVKEVVGGLIGSKLDIGGLGNIGWLLGGIQLVFLVMVALVSWRAAVIAALAIPLSLIFSTIYIYFIGANLNTLVLFSLVLVIGLVVDPALVILESIQRKIDAGLKGKDAALAAVKDVGNGLFLASLTNIIVFLPFGVVSGILGQIIKYIPMTIIPAVIGSYVVPLIFLGWFGSLWLKPAKRAKSHDEEENLWSLAKWLIAFNYRIITGSRLVRILIIVIAIVVPMGIAGYYFSTGKVTMVQFSSSDNSDSLQVSGSFLAKIAKSDQAKITEDLLKTVAENKAVESVYPYQSQGQGQFTFIVNLTKTKTRADYTAKQASNDINKAISEKFKDTFFDIKAGVASIGPPEGGYQIAIAVKTDNLDKMQKASQNVRSTLLATCLKNKVVSIDETCADGQKLVAKVDDGFTDKENKVIEVLLDRNKLTQNNLVVPSAPLSIAVNTTLKQLFQINDGKKVGTVNLNGIDSEIVLDKQGDDPKSIDDIKNTQVPTAGGLIKLSDIADVHETTPKSSIERVKGQTLNVVQAGLVEGKTDQGTAALVTKALVDHYQANDQKLTKDLGLDKNAIDQYSESGTAAFAKSFTQLFTALLLAILLTYIVLSLFFKSFTQPLVILFTIPLTFIGIFPALAAFAGGQFGFLEIIGMIILVGVVENVAIFLIDAANQKIDDGWDERRAIAYASGIRLRPVILTKLTAIASLAPLAFESDFYRSLAVVIIFGLLTSGFTSLFTTPILFIFFKWLSHHFRQMPMWHQILFFPFFPFYLIAMAIKLKPYHKTAV